LPAGAVMSDRFDEMTWREIYDTAPALRELADDLGERHDYATDLIRDLFLAACKASPVIREAAGMDPSRLVNRQMIAGALASREFTELRRDTAGDPFASAMAVVAMGPALHSMLDRAEEAQQAADRAAQARTGAAAAAQAVSDSLEQAAGQAGQE